jgi:hypothetical protein
MLLNGPFYDKIAFGGDSVDTVNDLKITDLSG